MIAAVKGAEARWASCWTGKRAQVAVKNCCQSDQQGRGKREMREAQKKHPTCLSSKRERQPWRSMSNVKLANGEGRGQEKKYQVSEELSRPLKNLRRRVNAMKVLLTRQIGARHLQEGRLTL